MKKNALGKLTWILAAVAVLMMSTTVDAKRRKRRQKKAAVNVEALAALKGSFEFGMTKKDVLKILAGQIREKYAEKVSATTDVYQQDKLRRKRDAEVKRIKDSFVDFDGSGKTGWEGSIIQDQFAHKTGESMLMFFETDPDTGLDQRRFFFFHEGALYKMFIALNSDALKDEQRNFDFLRKVMEARYGPGDVTTTSGPAGAKKAKAIHWEAGNLEAWAIDNMQVFGSFCLVVGDRSKIKQVASARDALPKTDTRVRLIDGIIETDDKPFELDENSPIDALAK